MFVVFKNKFKIHENIRFQIKTFSPTPPKIIKQSLTNETCHLT